MNKIITKFKLNRAANARKWKHKEGGFLKLACEIRKALEGTKFDWQTFATDIGTNLLQAMSDNNKASSELQAQLALNSLDYASTMENLARLNRLENENRFLKWLNDYLSGRTLDLPSNIVNNSMGYAGFSRSLALENLKLLNKNKQALFGANLKIYSGWGNALSGIIMSGLQAKKRRGTVEVGSPQAISVEKVD